MNAPNVSSENVLGRPGRSRSASSTKKGKKVIESEVDFEMMPGLRYNSMLLFVKNEQQFYCLNTTSSNYGDAYKCYVSGCSRRIYVRNGKCFINNSSSHKHPNKSNLYFNLCALNEIKTVLRSVENQQNPRKVFDDVIGR